MFLRFNTHLFANDPTILIKGSIEKNLSENLIQLEEHAKIVLLALEKYSKDILLPMNVNKTKTMLFHNAVVPEYPNVFFLKIRKLNIYGYLNT